MVYESDIIKAEIARLQIELAQARAETQATYHTCAHTMAELRADAAKLVHALDAAIQTVDALIAWIPEGLSLSPEVGGCKERLDEAMKRIFRK